MNVLPVLLIGWAAMAVVMLALWIVQRATRNAGIVDVLWAFTLGGLVAWLALLAPGVLGVGLDDGSLAALCCESQAVAAGWSKALGNRCQSGTPTG